MIRFLILFIISPILTYGQNTIIDARDSQTYGVMEIGELLWMTENLNYNVEGSLKSTEGSFRFYSYDQLENLCPSNWRLPKMNEWNYFVDSFKDVETAKMMEENDKLFRVDFLAQYNIFNQNSLKIRPFGRVEGGEIQRGNFIDFWTSNEDTKDLRFHMHLTPFSIMGHGHKHHLKPSKPEEYRMFPVRCVKEIN